MPRMTIRLQIAVTFILAVDDQVLLLLSSKDEPFVP